MLLHLERAARARADARLALHALVTLGGVEVGLAVDDGKKAVGARIDAGAARSAVSSGLRESRHDCSGCFLESHTKKIFFVYRREKKRRRNRKKRKQRKEMVLK